VSLLILLLSFDVSISTYLLIGLCLGGFVVPYKLSLTVLVILEVGVVIVTLIITSVLAPNPNPNPNPNP